MSQARQMAQVAVSNAAAAAGRNALPEALRWFREAARLDPADWQSLMNAGACCLKLGDPSGAVEAYLAAVGVAPEPARAVRVASQTLEHFAGASINLALGSAELRRALLACFGAERVAHQSFSRLAVAEIKGRGPLAPAFARLRQEGAAAALDWALSKKGRNGLLDPLLLAVLERTVNTDVELEALLVGLRRALLLQRGNDRGLDPFLAALARQCRNNEFVWDAGDDERAALAEPSASGVLAACYRPLGGDAEAAARREKSPALRRFLQAEAEEARRAARIAQALPVLAPPTDAASQAVAGQYDATPYPRWLSLNPPEPGARLGELAGLWGEPREAVAARDLAVLIAGCGTGKQAVNAAFYYGPRARLTAVDISRSALTYAAAQAERFGCGNLSFALADILDLGRHLPAAGFDVIECIGVLHHMAEPLAGWRVLAGLLRPGGVMQVALYSSLAREALAAARAEFAAEGQPPGDDAVRSFRRRRILGQGVGAAFAESYDCFSLGSIRDLFFHVQETCYTIPRIERELAALGLEFVDFCLPEAARRRVGMPRGSRDLALWDDCERRNPSLFAGMYSFWCRKPG